MNILSITGGGVRGIIACRFLLEIERITKTPIYKLFDFLGGTSVGTLIISGVLLTDDNISAIYSMEEIFNIFVKELPNAFSWTYSSYIWSVFGLYGPKYTSDGLKNIITKICGDRIFSSMLRDVCYPAYDKINNKAYYFDKNKDKNIKIADIILSCTSAPTYFPSINIEIDGKKYDFVDLAELYYGKTIVKLTLIMCIANNLGSIMAWDAFISNLVYDLLQRYEFSFFDLSLEKTKYLHNKKSQVIR